MTGAFCAGGLHMSACMHGLAQHISVKDTLLLLCKYHMHGNILSTRSALLQASLPELHVEFTVPKTQLQADQHAHSMCCVACCLLSNCVTAAHVYVKLSAELSAKWYRLSVLHVPAADFC